MSFRFLTCAFILAVVLTGCSHKEPLHNGSSDKAPLRVGVSPDFPPIAFLENDVLKGLEIDLAFELGKSLDREIVFVQKPFKHLIHALKENEIDIIMSGMSVTPERGEDVLFSRSYSHVNLVPMVNTRNAGLFKLPTDLFRYTGWVGFASDTTAENFVRQYLGGVKPVGFPDPAGAVNALSHNHVDVVIVDDIHGAWADGDGISIRMIPWHLSEEQLAWAVRKEDKELARKINKIISGWLFNGMIQKIMSRWS